MTRGIGRMSGRVRAQLLGNKRQKWRANAFKSQKGRCFYCACEMVLEPRNKFEELRFCTLDHKLPLSRGGLDHWENSAAACAKCNQDKANKTASEYRAILATRSTLSSSERGPSPAPHPPTETE